MKRVKIIGYQKVADFSIQGQGTVKGSRIYYISELNDYQKNAGAKGMEAGSQFLSANRFNYPEVSVGSYYDLDVVKKTAVALTKVTIEDNKS